jgi:hypothetical protein
MNMPTGNGLIFQRQPTVGCSLGALILSPISRDRRRVADLFQRQVRIIHESPHRPSIRQCYLNPINVVAQPEDLFLIVDLKPISP